MYAWVQGEVTSGACVRGGLLRRTVFDKETNHRVGFGHSRENTQGTQVDRHIDALYWAGQTPWLGGLFEWSAAYTRAGYEQLDRSDRALTLEVARRQRFEPGSFVTQLDFRYGLSGEHRGSTVAGLDSDRWSVFVALDIRFGGLEPGGTTTEGSSRLDRRGTSGGSSPKVQRVVAN